MKFQRVENIRVVGSQCTCDVSRHILCLATPGQTLVSLYARTGTSCSTAAAIYLLMCRLDGRRAVACFAPLLEFEVGF
jgi:hypothetical protein